MDSSIINKVSETIDSKILQQNPNANVDKSERIISVGAGAFLALKGITNVFSHPLIAIAELGIGGSLLYRGLTGYCAVKEKFDNQDSFGASVPASPAVQPTEAY